MAQYRDNIKYEEDFFVNSRGNRLFTCSWTPRKSESRALIFICHGYGGECSISMGDTAARLVHRGYAVHGIDHEGHGKSSGSKGYISSFSDVVGDCSDHFKSVCEKQENRLKKRFLYGFSMGGAVVLQLHRKDTLYWDGAVLLAPFCKMFDNMRPHPIIVSALKMISTVAPSWRVIPATDMIDKVCKDPQFKKEIRSNPYMYKGNLALQTGHELLSVGLDIEKNLHEVSLPFLVLHGNDDVVADPSGSKLLHERASSRDKTLKLYPGMWHVLMGERPEDVERIFADVISWLDDRVGATATVPGGTTNPLDS
ncbi:caffeoylshikimate esterase-like [Miscanthus floridulus]|uniref:caffeoylshikimate esterase-like n=1 Tax=Miscanthus floridulus TaxID=154761 RepID=UPI003459B1AD